MSIARDYLERIEIGVLESPAGQRGLAWYRRLPDREQFLLQVMSIALVGLCVIALLAVPSSHFLLNAASAYERANTDRQWLEANEEKAVKVAAMQGRPVDANSLVSTSVASAKRFGLEFRRYEPTADGDLRIWMEHATFDSVVGWIADLSKSHQLNIDSITVSPEPATGKVNVRLEIKG